MSNLHTFVLVEGVNIYDTLFDTDQLSVIRGGSFLLKEAIEEIARHVGTELERLSTGASSGLFRINHDAGWSGAKAVEEINEYLRNAERDFHHFTFLVEQCVSSSLSEARERLYARLRFRQLRSISSAPDPAAQGASPGPCGLEGIRARPHGGGKRFGNDDERRICESVDIRLSRGRGQRVKYYGTELRRVEQEYVIKGLEHIRFAEDLHTLTDDGRYRTLKGKMAVFYVDGNHFGRAQRDRIKEAAPNGEMENEIAAQRRFDDEIKDKRADYLAALLATMLADGDKEGWFHHALSKKPNAPDAVLRLETLQWGGDESLLVVPAWLGMDLLQHFFTHTGSWNPLTHAAGIVFCSAKSPIRRIQTLARELAEGVKNSDGGRDGNFFDYMVLESVDYPTEADLEQTFEARYGPLAKSRPAKLAPHPNWPEMKQRLGQLLSERLIARRQAYGLVRQFAGAEPADIFGDGEMMGGWSDVTNPGINAEKLCPLALTERRLLDTAEQRQELIDAMPGLFELFGVENKDEPAARAWMWIHLVELWDYLVPPAQTANKGETP